MGTTIAPSYNAASPLSQIKVNVRLCGSVPRHEMEALSLKQPNYFASSSRTSINTTHSCLLSGRPAAMNSAMSPTEVQQWTHISSVLQQEHHPQATPAPQVHMPPTYEPPSWAVPAGGEARLEPVCDSVDRQPPVDLSARAVFRVGRSPQSDVQLMHATSSRRHAMLFHHANGSCYIVDCGSAHGTYVNGVRVTSAPTGGVVVPHKIRQGSLIRFGGQGAPCFMLKSFAFELESMRECDGRVLSTPMPSTPDMNAVVEHNTRFNSLGTTAKQSLLLQFSSKRSYESLATVDEDERCPSPPMSPEQRPPRLVSPDSMSQPSKRRRVTFSDTLLPPAVYSTLVSPDVSSDEHECD